MPAQSTWPQLRIQSEDNQHIANVLAANDLRAVEFWDDYTTGRLLTLTESLVRRTKMTLRGFRERIEELFNVYYSEMAFRIGDLEISEESLQSPNVDLGEYRIVEGSVFVFTTCWTRATVEAALKRAGLNHVTFVRM